MVHPDRTARRTGPGVDALGKDWFEIREGEASIFKPDGAGKAALIGRVQIEDWEKAKK